MHEDHVYAALHCQGLQLFDEGCGHTLTAPGLGYGWMSKASGM